MTAPSSQGWLSSPRQVAAWLLAGYAGAYLVFQFFNWVLPDGGTFSGRSHDAGFTALVILAMPLLAVLFATGAGQESPLPQTRLIAAVALVEYGAMVLLGGLTFLIGLGSLRGRTANETFDGLAYVVLGIGALGLAALAGAFVYRAWVGAGGTLPVRLVRARPSPPAPPAL
jgi:hypothetical protein